MDIARILMWKYPTANPMTDFIAQDDGTGPYIAVWNEAKLGPKPTNEQLRSWWLQAEKSAVKREIGRDADTAYKKIFTVDGEFRELERDDVMQKKLKQEIGNVTTVVPLAAAAQADEVEMVKTRRTQKIKEVNDFVQLTGETLEQAVARVRNITY